MDLEARIRRLEDIEEIRNLRLRYHQFINDGLLHRFPELYTEDAVVDLGYMALWSGREEIDQGFRSLPAFVDLLVQFIHNHLVEVDGDQATGLAYFEARYGKDGESYMVAGRYEETYGRQSDGRWLIRTTKVTFHFSVPLSVGWAGAERHQLRAVIESARPD